MIFNKQQKNSFWKSSFKIIFLIALNIYIITMQNPTCWGVNIYMIWNIQNILKIIKINESNLNIISPTWILSNILL